ncbi:helix-turn-helix domain-containing protein [Photobacterium damselae]|uniref:helix-turn-helix domain-containing protein n=1 Tax=Photobacterium damselae TaxID=38293 RepID=UPI0010FDDDF0|nr:helix-turn-helix transcriptional regulator [Photobacterium damselae]MCG3824464.1 helix-turn-helix transcriptional regulator [Photobacterium damselae]TLS78571.1 helix-turn-helix transcriptional regulator [Photobacterium damselae subsp. damselae]TLS88533.1 helix-turn-helix transcriptional regulator [Photobacterium damselae subsp. damselae]
MNVKILKSRYKLRLSQEGMARLLGISKNAYINIETGKVKPKADVLYKLSKKINKNVAYFYHDQDDFIEKISEVHGLNNNILILFEILIISDYEFVMENEKT